MNRQVFRVWDRLKIDMHKAWNNNSVVALKLVSLNRVHDLKDR